MVRLTCREWGGCIWERSVVVVLHGSHVVTVIGTCQHCVSMGVGRCAHTWECRNPDDLFLASIY